MRASIARPHWSYSSVSQYLKCPLQFYFERVAKLPRKSTTDAQVLGSALHSGLADYHRRLQARQPVTPQQVHEAYLAAWDEQVKRSSVVAIGAKSVDDSRDLGVSLIDVYLQEPAPEGIIAVETSVLAPVANSQGEYLEKPILVIADLVVRLGDGTLQINEIKTSGRAYSESEVATSLQPTCYAGALYETTGEEPGVEFQVLVKTRVPKVQKIQATRTVSDFGRLGDIIGAVELGVHSGVFYPVESPINCSGCPFYRPCKEWSGTSVGRVTNQLDLGELAAC